MNENYNIYHASNRLAISSRPIEGITHTIDSAAISSPEELCRTLESHSQVAIITPSPLEAYEKIAAMFIEVTAAGGLATSPQGDHLMIFRNHRWDLPKGHWESGETIEECALREVEEETGEQGLTLGSKICETIHIYKMRGKWEIKRTHWFEMFSPATTPLIPQREEGITRTEWCSKEAIRHFLPNSYPTIQQVFSDAGVL